MLIDTYKGKFRPKPAKRHYRALIQGTMPTPTGTISTQIGRHPVHREKMQVVTQGGRIAVTHWEEESRLGPTFSWVRLALETGRTHQIRVHLTHLGHPIFGDPQYGSGLHTQWGFDPKGQQLQAVELIVVHPVTETPMVFSLPPDPRFERTERFIKQRFGIQ